MQDGGEPGEASLQAPEGIPGQTNGPYANSFKIKGHYLGYFEDPGSQASGVTRDAPSCLVSTKAPKLLPASTWDM